MGFISVTRLRLRSIRYLPAFGIHTTRSLQQVKTAEGFQQGAVLADHRLAFWTLTMWDEQPSMRRYMTAGSHRVAMPRLMKWCDEASVVHWTIHTAILPSWDEADSRMRQEGRTSKVLKPSPDHADLTFKPSSHRFAGPINRPA
jgi:hypothetical protein